MDRDHKLNGFVPTCGTSKSQWQGFIIIHPIFTWPFSIFSGYSPPLWDKSNHTPSRDPMAFTERRHAKRFPHHYYSTWLRNPAPVDRWFIPLFIGFQPSLWWCRISQPSTVGSILRGLTNQAWSEVQEEHLDLKSFLVHDWRLQQSLTGIDHHFLIHSGTSQQSLTGIDRHGFRSEPRNY